MTIRDLYKKDQIMPQLETHMLRVAGVGKMIAENWRGKCDQKLATELCLIHDMRNIVKFDLRDNIDRSKFGKFGEIENLPYWQKFQQENWEKYGKDAHDATIGILRSQRALRWSWYPYLVRLDLLV